jgi:predicted nucleotidyltransferase
MVSVSNIILKKCFNLYDDSSLYANYSKIANNYSRQYKIIKDKKFSQENQDKLKEDVKKWLFAQSLESRMKICTVENELFGKLLYGMYFHSKLDKTMCFKPKSDFLVMEEDNNNNEPFTKNINNLDNFNKNKDEINYPKNNNDIKITKTNKNGKKTEAPKLGYSQSSLSEFSDEEILQNNFGNYFKFFSSRGGSYTLATPNNYNNNNIKNSGVEDLFKNIIFFSVHHKYFPDCFTLSPELLNEKEKFENYFSFLGNKNYFSFYIQPKIFESSKSQKEYGYMLPYWFKNNEQIEEIQHSAAQYALIFFEQVIMIKYLLNRNEKKIKYFSLLNEEAFEHFFKEREFAIDNMNKNYNKENKNNILNELNTNEYYQKVITDKYKMAYVNYFKLYRKNIDCERSPYIDSINYNPHSNKYEEQYNKINKITKPKNIKISRNTNSELTYEEMVIKLKNNLETKDNIYFIDYILFDNFLNLWKLESFFKGELFEKMSKLFHDKLSYELIDDFNFSQKKQSKPRHRRKNKKNKKEEEKNNNINNDNKIKNENDGEGNKNSINLLMTNSEDKKNEKDSNKNKEIEEIKNFISNEIIKGLIIDRIFLIPLNNCLDFFEKYKEENIIIEKNEIKEEEKIVSGENRIEVEQAQKENEDVNDKIENKEDDLDLRKSESMSITTQDTNNIISSSNLDIIQKAKSSELICDDTNEKDINDNSNSNSNNNSNNKNSSKKKKKPEKEQKFFLFDTVKKKKKKSNTYTTNNNALISNEFNIITTKESNTRLSFFEKLHNDIIKYETKVITLLNHGMKFQDYCITEIKRIIQETLNFSNDYTIEIYGSYATGLMIEASDIDIKIKLKKGTKTDLDSFFKKVCEQFESCKKFDEITPIETASVPVIKLILSKEKFIKGKTELENSYKQFKELSLFKHYLFDIKELTKIKIDVTFLLSKDNLNNTNTKEDINKIKNENNNSENTINNLHDHDKLIESEISSVDFVKEQITKYPEIKFILRVLKRYFYYKKMNTAFLGGLSSYNLFLLLLSYAKFLDISQNSEKGNLGYFLFHFLYFFKIFDFKQYIVNINSENNIYDIISPEKIKEFNFGKSIVIIDPITGVNASKSSYKIDDIQNTFSEAYDFFQNEQIKYDKEGKTKVNKKKNNNDTKILMGLPISNKNENNHGGGNIIEKFLGK